MFGSGTIQWAWGLDNHHDNANGIISQDANCYDARVGVDQSGPEPAIQQATVNFLADMHVFPTTIEHGLVHSTSTNDVEAPSCHVTAAKLQGDGSVLVNVQAADVGGVVASVEVRICRYFKDTFLKIAGFH